MEEIIPLLGIDKNIWLRYATKMETRNEAAMCQKS
jgi:hypothetical protein